MKKSVKLLGAACSLTMLMSGLAMAVSAETYDTKKTEAIKGTPTIDGKMDDIWKKANKIEANLVNKTLIPSESTTTAECYTMWDDNYFYFIGIVKDSAVHEEGGTAKEDVDSVELGFDELNSKKSENVPAGDPAAGSFRVGVNGELSGFGDKFTNAGDKFKGAATKTDTGYIVEMAIPFDKLTPEEGKVVSMEVQINDNMEGKGRSGLVTWNSDKCLGWQSSEAQGEVKLVAAPAEGGDSEPDSKPTPPTGDALPVAAAGLLVLSVATAAGTALVKKGRK